MTVPFWEVHLDVFVVFDFISNILDRERQLMVCKLI